MLVMNADQIARERMMRDKGQRRATAIIERALERGEAAETPAGVALARRAIAPLAEGIKEFVEAAFKGGAGRRATAAKLLKGVDPELAAYITVRSAIASAARRYTLKSTAMALTERLEMELVADAFEAQNDPLYRSVVRNARARGLSMQRIGKAVDLATRKFDELEPLRRKWTPGERLQLGTKLVELLIERVGIARAYMVRDGRKHVQHRVEFAAGVDEWFKKYNHAAALTRPLFLPTLVPPKDWDGVRGGSYYSEVLGASAIVTRAFPGQLDALAAADMPAVYAGLNALQGTAWRVNKRVLEVMQHAWENNLPGLPLPAREDEPLPEAPPEVVNDVVGGTYRKAFRALRRSVHERNAKARSVRFEFDRALIVARENDQAGIWFPHRLDFRGRAYASSTSLNPQGPDEIRALLEFSEGKPLGRKGLYWLGVHGANLWGFDKVSLDERRKWSGDNYMKVLAVARDPLGERWWTEADKPWSFLAWCLEWADAFETTGMQPQFYVSHMPIALDGSCNGIQHLSAMLLDPVGGAAVNLVPGPTPQDIYAEVANVVMRKLEYGCSVEGPDQWVHEAWWSFGIDRKVTKRSVMVLPYGGTFKSCRDYVREAIRDRFEAGQANPFGDELRRAENLLAKLVWEAIGEVVVASRTAMGWLQDVARVATKAKIPLRWTTPSGFVVMQDYREKKENRIRTKFCGSVVKFQSMENTKKLDRYKQVSAVSPNFVHSLDASALQWTIWKCKEAGINSFAMVHDSYGTHAADTESLATILREVFVWMYQEVDVLQRFRDEIAAQLPAEVAAELPPVPAKGNLDLEGVLRSDYFFS